MTIGLVAVVAVLLAAGGIVAWRAGGPASAPWDPATPVRLTVLAYLAFHGIGSLIVLLTGESSGSGPLLAASGLLAFGAGTWLATRLLGPTPAMPRGALDRAGVGRSSYRPWVVIGLAVVGMVSLGALVGQYGIPLISSNPQASRAGFAGPLFDLFRWLVPPAALVAFAVALATGERRDRWVAAAALLGVGGLEIALASRALPLELATAALLVAWWAGRALSARAAAAFAGAALVLFVGVQLVRVGPEGGFTGAADVTAFAIRRTVDRVLLIHPRTIEIVAREIPANEPYFGGATYVRRLAVLLGNEDRPALGYWIYERLFPGESGGFAAPGVVGEAWANGGPVLVVAIMTALGALAQVAGRLLAGLRPGPTTLTFAALVSIAFARSYATSLNGTVLTLGVVTAWWLATTVRGRPASEARPPDPEGPA